MLAPHSTGTHKINVVRRLLLRSEFLWLLMFHYILIWCSHVYELIIYDPNDGLHTINAIYNCSTTPVNLALADPRQFMGEKSCQVRNFFQHLKLHSWCVCQFKSSLWIPWDAEWAFTAPKWPPGAPDTTSGGRMLVKMLVFQFCDLFLWSDYKSSYIGPQAATVGLWKPILHPIRCIKMVNTVIHLMHGHDGCMLAAHCS